MTQHYDTVKEIGSTPGTNTIFVPYTPGGLNDIAAQLRDALIGGSAAAANMSAGQHRTGHGSATGPGPTPP